MNSYKNSVLLCGTLCYSVVKNYPVVKKQSIFLNISSE